jgi:hypothetical protein
MPTLPLAQPAAQVALHYPLRLAAIRISGKSLMGARIWISTLHPSEPFDQCQWQALTSEVGSDCHFSLPADLSSQAITAVRVAADLAAGDRELRLSLTAAEEQP